MQVSAPQLLLGELLDRRCVATGRLAVDAADAVRQAARLLADVGVVTPDYGEAAVRREAEFPTGLSVEPSGVALPHADGGVLRPGVALLTLRAPVAFGAMGTESATIPVQVIVLLALPAGDQHVQAIGALAEMIQQPQFVTEILRAQAPDALYTTFQTWAARLPGHSETNPED